MNKPGFLFDLSRWLLPLVLMLSVFNTYAASEQTSRSFSFAVVPQFSLSRIHNIWQPVLDELKNKTGFDFVLKNYSSIPAFEQGFANGEFDFGYMNPYHSIIAHEKQGYIPLIKDSGRKLYGIFVVDKNSAIKIPQDLEGKTLAFPAPNALGASLMIRAKLQDEYAVNIEPLYVKTHTSVYLNVALGRVAGGGGVQKTFSQQKPELKDGLHILFKTQEVEPHPTVAHSRISEVDRNTVRQAFLEMGQNDKTAALLSKIPIKKVGEAKLQDYDAVKALRLERFAQ